MLRTSVYDIMFKFYFFLSSRSYDNTLDNSEYLLLCHKLKRLYVLYRKNILLSFTCLFFVRIKNR
jgi:hypothetical protein